ncbi:Mak10 subunit, NatC N-terminal acetyltransferase-domain-containing protein [Russula ochroleuca]|uniref:Mak10 subunit, NatC N-terminal acetyltransferase-domain-containing protein n=1 Tax=Russula ochroleuca TaxID=152965 RepID=A0A9P5MP08_9AGAM|nr:Mak10 subunit, NatC N-terminal acetyltransferase-domain-containing protein [Russula ochroleuca]
MSTEPLSIYCPPGNSDYVDISDVFLDAAEDMEQGDVILTEDFTLYDAMSALEIGNPRMDSGLILDDEAKRPQFNPLTTLLPEEVCYILDRVIACEMEWHAGYTLPQTIYSCLYVHYLADIDPEESARHSALVTVVLNTAITALLKCCDLSWRELNRGRLHDTEDWHSEKFGVSLLESLPVASVLSRLDDAKNCIQTILPEPSPWRSALLDRISLRAAMLNLFRHHPSKDRDHFVVLLSLARNYLQSIRSNPPPEPPPHSPAALAFDINITRKLNNFMPLKAHCLPPQDFAWNALADLLDGWADICKVSAVASLTTWKVAGELCADFARPSRRPPFLRALAQSVFFSNQRVLEVYPLGWLVDRFSLETVGIEYHTLSAAAEHTVALPLLNIERKLSRALLSHIQSAWFNPPRRRRFLARSLLEWQELYDSTSSTGEKGNPIDEKDRLLIDALSDAVLLWRLSIIREVLLSGFQLELYVEDEKPFVYWELSQVAHEHLSTLNALEPVVPKDTRAYGELIFTSSYLSAFRSLCTGMFILTLPALRLPASRLALNFVRRYKWAFRPEYARLRPQVAAPDLLAFASASADVLKDEQEPLRLHFERARDGLAGLSGSPVGVAGPWHEDRLQVARSLSSIAGELALAVPATIVGLNDFDAARLDWARLSCRWFPGVSDI